MRLTTKEMDRLFKHYTGNCFSCPRCTFYERITNDEPDAVEEYVRYMKEKYNENIRTLPS